MSSDENPDLYWALRGGGGNFGVVTSFLFRLHDVPQVFAGPTFWDVEQSADVLRVYRDFIGGAPRELNGFFALARVKAQYDPDNLFHVNQKHPTSRLTGYDAADAAVHDHAHVRGW